QSWVGALTTILDTAALLLAGVDGPDGYQARLTFAMARHAAVDLGLVFQTPPSAPAADRLPAEELARAQEGPRGAGAGPPRGAAGVGGVGGLVGAVRQRAGGVLRAGAAAVLAGAAAGGQLADQCLDAAGAGPGRPGGGGRRGRSLRLSRDCRRLHRLPR